jgi:calcineurin-like phosphoesterase family protein
VDRDYAVIFFTSDHHFGHANIIRYCQRPFADVDQMNLSMHRLWNETVQPSDTVYYLGDLAFYHTFEQAQALLASLHGNKVLIRGNHDDKLFRPKRWLEAGFVDVRQEMKVTIGKYKVLLSHYPRKWGLDSPLAYRLHGHVHQQYVTKGRSLNLSVDVHSFIPVSEPQVVKFLDTMVAPTPWTPEGGINYA